MDIKECNICLQKDNVTVSVNDSDEQNVKWITKLQFIVPELEIVEEWQICTLCIKQLEKASEFKSLLLSLLTKQKRIPKNEECDDSNKSISDVEYHSQHEKEFVCMVCYKAFTTLTQLQQHSVQLHYMRENVEKDENDLKVLHEGEDKKNSTFSCFHCNENFHLKSQWLHHIRNLHEFELCLICEKVYSNKTGLNSHIKEEHGILKNSDLNENINDKIKTDRCLPLSQCKLCKECFSTKKLLGIHSKICKNQESSCKSKYQCGLCSNFYTTDRNLSLHKTWCKKEASGSESRYISCDVCVIKFSTAEEYELHNSAVHKTKRRGRKPLKKFSCEMCNKQFEYVKLVIEHCISIHSMDEKAVKPYSCEKCHVRFASSANLDQHRNYHEKSRNHICSLCGKAYITKSDLTFHKYTHYNRRNYKCTKCEKAFNTNKNLRTHILVVHTDRSLWKYGCNICEKRFPLKTNYEQHMRRHSGDKKYACHICKKSFVSKSEVQRHINLHSNIKAHQCVHCDKEYKERRTYTMHLARVHGIGDVKLPVREKKFVCHICPSQFYDKQKLSRHLCSHSGLKPFSCYSCDKKFTDKSYLKQHLKTVHNIVEPLKMDCTE